MNELCIIAPQYNFKIKDCGAESLREWFWLYFFLENETPGEAITETQEYDQIHNTKHQ